ncbi:hypothetical protein V6N11_073572 [Hibiscus sabdariffa]|uniref:Uncharacterized protein n=1 Tax=Hibiscus sabdariffa TaxID=183260 RepID=A0ABR2NU15_9ROSI
MDKATQEVINVIVDAQSQATGGPLAGISIGQGLPSINISRPVGLPELRRLRRTFIKLTGQTSLSGRPPPSDADSAKRMFVDYLNRELGTIILALGIESHEGKVLHSVFSNNRISACELLLDSILMRFRHLLETEGLTFDITQN